MYNIILFENELKMEKFDLNIVERKRGGGYPDQGIIERMTS